MYKIIEDLIKELMARQAPEGKVYQVIWADGRGVQYFDNLEAAIEFTEQPDRDGREPKLIDKPSGARVKSKAPELKKSNESLMLERVHPVMGHFYRIEEGRYEDLGLEKPGDLPGLGRGARWSAVFEDRSAQVYGIDRADAKLKAQARKIGQFTLGREIAPGIFKAERKVLEAQEIMNQLLHIREQTPKKLTNERATLRPANPKNPGERCRLCKFFQSPNVCAIVEGPVAPNLVCDWIQSRGVKDAPIYKIADENWISFGLGMIEEQPYQHIVKDVALTPEGPLVLIADTAEPPHLFSLGKEFHIGHTSLEHHWTQDEVDRLVGIGKKLSEAREAQNVSGLSNRELIELHADLHDTYTKAGDTPPAGIVTRHISVVQELARRGLEHRPKDQLDALTLKQTMPEVHLGDVAKAFQTPIILRKPFLAVVGSVTVDGKGKDLDIWVNWPASDKEFLRVLTFRIKSMLPPDYNVQLLPDHMGPFTNFMPIADLEVRFVPPDQREIQQMSEGARDCMPRAAAMRANKRTPTSYPVGFYRIFHHMRGKSVADYTPLIIRKDGGIPLVVSIEELWPDDANGDECELRDIEVWSRNGWEPAKRIYRHRLFEGERLVRIRTVDSYLDVTKDHSLFHDGKEVKAGDIRIGHMLDQSPDLPPPDGNEEVDEEIAWMYGFYLAEGSHKKRGRIASFSQKSPGPLRRIMRTVSKYGWKSNISQESGSKMWKLEVSGPPIWLSFYNRRVHEKPERASRHKKVPAFVYRWVTGGQKAFIDGYLAGDGHKSSMFEFGTSSQLLAQGIILLARKTHPEICFRSCPQSGLLRMAGRNRSHGRVASTIDRTGEVRSITESENANQKGARNGNFKDGAHTRPGFPGPSRFVYSCKRSVYDIETETHSFCAGVGRLLAHNSVHKDLRFVAKAGSNGHLEGWTITDQPAGAVKREPIPGGKDKTELTRAEVSQGIKKAYDIQGRVKWKFRPNMKIGDKVNAVKKKPQPLKWINVFNIAFAPGFVGATKEEVGVFTLCDEGNLTLGVQKDDFKEYFLDGKVFKGRIGFRLISTEGFDKPTRDKMQWQVSANLKDQTPNILSVRERRRDRKEQYVPKQGEKAIPPEWQKLIKPAHRWWQGGATAKDRIRRLNLAFNDLAEREIFKARLLKLTDKGDKIKEADENLSHDEEQQENSFGDEAGF